MSSEADPRRSWAFRRRVILARAVAAFEAAWSAAWPTLMLVGVFLVISLLGLWARLPVWLHALGLLAFLAGLVWTLWAAGAWRWPDRGAALRRLEQVNQLSHQPLRSLGDRLSGGADDGATRTLWRRHQERLRQAVRGLRVGLPRSHLAARDPWALRAAVVLLLLVALVEAGPMAPERLVQAFELGGGQRGGAASVETTLWVTPPAYTGRPPLRLEMAPPVIDDDEVVRAPARVAVPVGSEVLAQLHHLRGEPEGFVLALDDQGERFESIGADSAEAKLVIGRSGELRIGGPGTDLGAWAIDAIPDERPEIAYVEPPAATQRGVLRSHFQAGDDYGVASVALLLSRPGSGEPERIELMRPPGATTELDDAAFVDLTPHPWAGLPAIVRLEAVDGIGQRGLSEPQELVLPARNFEHPVARALIEQRRRLAATPEQRNEVAAILDQLANAPELYQDDKAVYLALNTAAMRLRLGGEAASDEVLELLWDTALHLEDGRLSLAERELRDLQEALREALAEGASDEELERLMAELQRAMDEFLEALAQQAQQQRAEGQESAPTDPNAMQLERQDLQQMMDALQEMIRTGARDAARQMLAQLQQLLENLQMAQSGEMQQGQQMMSQLQEMIQRQQELLDQTFGLSREQGQEGEQEGQGQRGEQGEQDGEMGGMQQGGGQAGRMAGNQESLRRALGELMRAIGEAGAQIPRSLGEAELSMRAARDALEQGQPGAALGPEAQALDQMRQGGQAMMQEMQRMFGQGQGQMPGQQFGQAPNDRDPLGRSMFNQGGADLWGERVPSELDLGRARAILDELYRRASQRSRPQPELEYLDRLLRRF